MARPGVMCLSVQADIDRKREQTVLRCRNHGRVNKDYCLAERQMPLIERTL